MPQNRRTDKFIASEARIKDLRDALSFCAERNEEGLFASFYGHGDDSFTALVIVAAAYREILDAENEALRNDWVPGEEPFVETTISNAAFTEHPLVRIGNSAVEALNSAHLAYLSSIATGETTLTR